jgi:hypothetical protein
MLVQNRLLRYKIIIFIFSYDKNQVGGFINQGEK